ncbi:MAG: AAA ATPase [Candidatus Peregrinibacteria bacterium GW2011_GWA2_44_7]|nr:MAG: AAA ATPase [Candidatus Peregrinibacteria bacterium GW2011_GWA2_44_7]
MDFGLKRLSIRSFSDYYTFTMSNDSFIELNEHFVWALEKIQLGENIFITGRAGTGKSTLLHYFCSQSKKPIVILAPTGVAAVNVKGQTIHHFFGFGPGITLGKVKKRISAEKKKLFEKLTTIIIDEISMVRADLLDCIDAFLRFHGSQKNKPFGGVQMVFIGDLYQLPPVVTSQDRYTFSQLYESPYFFSARSFEALEMTFIELEKVYRQKDVGFIQMLNAIRNKTAEAGDYQKINERHDPDFEPPEGELYISLTSTNADADKINDKEMQKLSGTDVVFRGDVEGDFPPSISFVPDRRSRKWWRFNSRMASLIL